MTEDQIMGTLIEYETYLKIGGMFSDFARSIGMGTINFFVWIVDSLTKELGSSLSVLTFYEKPEVKAVLETLRPIQSLILGVAILFIGLVLYTGKSAEVRNVPINAYLIICILAMLPSLMANSTDVLKAYFRDNMSGEESLGFKTVKANVTDIYVIGKSGWTSTYTPESVVVGPTLPGRDSGDHNYLKNLTFFDVNEKISDASKVDKDKVLDYKVIDKQGGEGYEVVKLDQGGNLLDSLVKSMISKRYYRWHINWFPILITLGCLAASLVLFFIRGGRLGLETAINYIWTNITAFASIRDMKRLKTAVMEIFVGFITLFSMGVMMVMYIQYNSFLETINVNMLVRSLLYVGGGWLLFDGPAIIQKTLGVDAGLSTAGGVLAGLGAGKAASKIDQIGQKAASGAAGIGGFVQGMREGADEKDEEKGINDQLEKEFEGQDASDSQSHDESDSGTESSGINDELDQEERSSDSDDSSGESNVLDDSSENNGINSELEGLETETGDISEDSTENGLDNDMNEPTSSTDESTSSQNSLENEITNSEAKDNKKEDSSNDRTKNEHSPSDKQNESNESNGANEAPQKPKNPLFGHIANEIATPKYMKDKGRIGNVIDSHQKSRTLGKDLNQYMKDRKEYKEYQKSEKKKK